MEAIDKFSRPLHLDNRKDRKQNTDEMNAGAEVLPLKWRIGV